ncbi:MAG: enoyl-CoA hydratase/isomerase family protein [Candidatus Tectomicrobia bacterium]|nr:enoyl-CoA hydratase/isomerase family protein [Candidatus Tectomicrobia bacterium]
MNRPERMNALNWQLLDDLNAAIKKANGDDEIRVMILTGKGNGFCTGADLSQDAREGVPDPGRRVKLQPFQRFGELAILLRETDKPVIAAVNGAAVGAGFAVALGCDIRIASDRARFSSIFVKRALVPDTGATYYLPRLIGVGKALEMMFTGEIIGAEEAERIGLVNRVVPHEELMGVTKELAEKIAKGPPIAIELTKRIVYKGLGVGDLATQVGYEGWAQSVCAQSEDVKEGRQAFLEKREPMFKGR